MCDDYLEYFTNRHFAVMIVQVLKIIYVNLSNSKMITKRDLFYQDTLLFSGRQETANALVDMLAFSFDVETHELGIVSNN